MGPAWGCMQKQTVQSIASAVGYTSHSVREVCRKLRKGRRVGMSGSGLSVVVGMSGGVDSSVAALALLRQGYQVVGVTCRFHDDLATTAAEHDASLVCKRLGISHEVFDATEDFERLVVVPFVADYANGLTPSPCVGCNMSCKVPSLIAAADELGCEFVATGHYARIARVPTGEGGVGGESTGGDFRFAVRTALDGSKDQSYMLSMLDQAQLARLVLPLGGMTKPAVRQVADQAELPVAQKAESQDICFLGEAEDYRGLLASRGVSDRPGPIVLSDGSVVGEHCGLHGYTVGQRKGLGVAYREPLYVIRKEVEGNRLVVGTADEALISAVATGPVNWQAVEGLREPMRAMVKLRYRSRPVPCVVEPAPGGGATVYLNEPQPTTAPGQYAVFYVGDTVIGAAVIRKVVQA